MSTPLDTIAPLRDFVGAMTRLVEISADEATLIVEGRRLLAQLIAREDWLPEPFTRPDPQFYRQFLLHADPLERFSVVSFVWGPGQHTPIHDHMVWGLIGMLRGAEISRDYVRRADGKLEQSGETRLEPGHVGAVSPTIGDIHVVANALPDRASISIHVYGGNIGAVKRAVYTPEGQQKPFISGYANRHVPNIWDPSREHQG